MRPGKKISIICIIVQLMVVSALPMMIILLPGAEGNSNYDTVFEGDHHRYNIGGDPNDVYSIDFSVQNGTKADVYIMTKNEYDNNYPDGNFQVSFDIERTDFFDGEKWTRPDNDIYYLIIDNLNNSRSSDENTTGDIGYYLGYYNETNIEEFFDGLGDAIEKGILAVTACCVLVIVIIIAIVVLLRKDKRDTVYIPAPGGYGPPPQYYPPPRPPQYQSGPPMAGSVQPTGQPPYQPPPGSPPPQQQPMPPMPPPVPAAPPMNDSSPPPIPGRPDSGDRRPPQY